MAQAKAVGPRIHIRVERKEEVKSKGGIILTHAKIQTDTEAADIGVVVDMGPDAYIGLKKSPSNTPWVNIGDKVFFRRYCGTTIAFKDHYIRIVNDDEIAALYVEDGIDNRDEVL